MSIFDSLYIGWSGMSAFSQDMQILSDNIANVSTPGFKSSVGEFEDLLYQDRVGASPVSTGQLGVGTRLSGVTGLFTQGSLTASSIQTDMAIRGDGFFMVRDTAAEGEDDLYYTRCGQFVLDTEGYLVNPDGHRLQGHPADADGVIGSGQEDILLRNLESKSAVTGTITLGANLDPEAEVIPFDRAEPFTTANHFTEVNVYDSEGKAHSLILAFNKEEGGGPNDWQVRVLARGDEIQGGQAGTYVDLTQGYTPAQRRLSFGADGTPAGLPVFSSAALGIDWAGGAADGAIKIDLGTAGNADGMTQHGGLGWGVRTKAQDGREAGVLSGFTVDEAGRVHGSFSNGESRTVSQVMLANFANESALYRAGANLFQSTAESGAAVVDEPGSSAFGSMHQAFLEASNVDLGREFIRLITSQRGFQVSSRVVQTMDSMIGSVVNLIR